MKKWLNEGCVGLLFIASAWPVAWSVESSDHQIANISWFAFLATGSLLCFLWLLRKGVNAWWKKFTIVAGLAGCAFAISQQIEFRGFSGELLPQLRWKLASSNDRANLTAFPRSIEKQAAPVTNDIDEKPKADDLSQPSVSVSFTQFMGSNRDGKVDGNAIQTGWGKNPPEVIWRIPVGAAWSGFVVADGLAITQEQFDKKDAVTAFDLNTGGLVWRTLTDRQHYHSLGGAGPRATPTIHENSVIAQSSTGVVTSMDLQTGLLNWSVDLLAKANIDQTAAEAAVSWGRSGSPLIVGDVVVVPLGAGLKQAGARTVSGLIALELATGEERWRAGESQISYASPSLIILGDRKQIVIVNESDVTGHDIKSGEILWKVDWPGQSNGPASVSQATQLDTQHLLLSKGYGGGSKLLKFSEKFVEPIEVEQIWHHPSIMKSKFMTPVVSGEYVYGLSDGVLECMRWSDGKKIWKDNRQGRLGHGQMLLVGNQLLCSSEDGRLVLTDATPEKPTSYESLSLLDGITWNPIAIAGDLVLVRNGEQAVCVRVKRE